MDRGNVASPSRAALVCALVALAIIPVNFIVFVSFIDTRDPGILISIFCLLALAQAGLGIVALVQGVWNHRKFKRGGIAAAIAGGLAFIGAPVGWVLGMAALALGSGGAWGRPLRIRGRQLHCKLREGSDWTRGRRPDPATLDEATRAALEALWLHDAQKEHASVPAFSRVSWLLAAVGAPADLLE